jgi:hypothetical protein
MASKPGCPGRAVHAEPSLGRSLGSVRRVGLVDLLPYQSSAEAFSWWGASSRSDPSRTQSARDELHVVLGRSFGLRASSKRSGAVLRRRKPSSRFARPLASRLPSGLARPKPGRSVWALPGLGCLPPRRSGVVGAPFPESCLPPAFTEVNRRHKTRSVGYERLLPWGSVPFGVFGSGDRCAGLPHRHLPLSGFLTLSAV